MKTMTNVALLGFVTLLLCGCGEKSHEPIEAGRKVETTGKQETDMDAVPDAVIAAALAARPELQITEAEHEVRDGREYYDVGGSLPDGSELELDMVLMDGQWSVVEFQRDVDLDAVPANVSAALTEDAPGWLPDRIIESDQGDGVVIYEFFGPGDTDDPKKIEVKLEDGQAEVLVDEWLH